MRPAITTLLPPWRQRALSHSGCAIDASLEEMRDGKFATEAQVSAVFDRSRRR